MPLLVEAMVTDSMHLELSKPVGLKQGGKVLLAVSDAADQGLERQQWLEGAAAGLNAAYGQDEPEYTASMIKEPNQGYGHD